MTALVLRYWHWVAIAVLILVHLLTGRAWLQARDQAAQAAMQLDAARADVSACSDATEDLRALADKRAREATAARTEAGKSARTHSVRADATLATAPVDPGDLCESMKALGDDWLRGRAAP